MLEPIDNFRDEFDFLSNFYPCMDSSAEHHYQAAKAADQAERLWVMTSKNAAEAKRRGKKVKLRSDWSDAVKIDVMRKILHLKFSNNELRLKLLATGNRKLIEGNWWGDTFWGVCKGKGENWLGRLLMELRSELSEINEAN